MGYGLFLKFPEKMKIPKSSRKFPFSQNKTSFLGSHFFQLWSYDAVFDPNAVGLRWFKQTDLSMVGLVKVALDILQDWEEDGGDGEEDGE